MRKINNVIRKRRYTKNKILIAVEGSNKTEKIYFNNFDTGKEKYSITIAKGNDTDPLKLVKGLIKEVKKLELDLKNGDKVFCVFDVDTNVKKNCVIKEAITLANKNKIEIITSTPSIELWFLLHFEYTTAYLTNNDLIKRLKNYYSKYTKNTNIYLDIEKNMLSAIKRAEKLEKYQLDNNKTIGSVEANPNTEMYKIVNYLLKNR